ncbi:hypothetical protein [Sphingobacterium suaedae]|uniref:ApeI dehydratase-like domain-containing protein n=1 Tax=Sphingobacterium suaedae TaxID=1686402 RepID=A0ABW5KMU2_9SPHI
MSILTDFYHIEQFQEVSDSKYMVAIRLNPEHEIFEGHFPGNPVTPGVCMMQIVKDVSEQITRRRLFLTRSTNVKFMALINPLENPDIVLDIELSYEDGELVKVKNVSSFGGTIALKLTNVYKIIK